MLKAIILVGVGGFIGSACRYVLSLATGNLTLAGSALPPTLLVNIIGCFLIGLLLGFSGKFSKEMMLLTTTGFCGGFTTFSTFSYESLQFIQKGDLKTAFLYMGLSLVIGLIFTFSGIWLAKNAF
ncbi:MAG: fluoride efflux transporter CrcB [Cyclobacteriaceae bacterium]